MDKFASYIAEMKTETFELLTDIFFMLFLLSGTLWMWGKIKFGKETQERWDKTFERSRKKFKLLFLFGFLIVTGMFIWKHMIV
ncbi:MAG: hypothetical protein H7X71_01630 [Chitinophagales bacterium]|nr:hypothetical protein [Chitinophagales bacterium]